MDANSPLRPYTDKLSIRAIYLLITLCIGFALLPTRLDWSTTTPQGDLTEGSLVFQLQFATVFLLGAWIAWRNRAWSFFHLKHINPFLLLFVLYCALTILWSPYPVTTIKRVIQLIGLIIVAIAIAPPVVHPKQFINTLLMLFTVLMLFSMVFALVFPSIGVQPELNNAWRGILQQKNSLGAVSSLCAIFWLKQLAEKNIRLGFCLLGICFSLFMLIMSKSTTALIMFILCGSLYLIFRKQYIYRNNDGIRFLLGLFVVLLLSLMAFYVVESRLPVWNEIFSPINFFFNKSADLTGRTDIWNLVFLSIESHPILGIGYGAFWLGQGSPSQYIIDYLYWMPLQAHNGYLDIWNELGYVGLGLVACVFIVHIRNLIKFMKVDRIDAAIHLIFFVYIIVSNFSESELFRGVSFQNILFILSSVAVSSRLSTHDVTSAPATQ